MKKSTLAVLALLTVIAIPAIFYGSGAWDTPNSLEISGSSGGGGGGSGTITGVSADAGLTGGGTSGVVSLGIDYTASGVWSGPQTYTGLVTYTSTVTHNQIGIPTWTTQQTAFVWQMGVSSVTAFEVGQSSTGFANRVLYNLKFQGREEWNNLDMIGNSNNAWYTAVTTAPFYGKATFAASASTATNIGYLYWFSGDFDTTTVPTAYLADFQGGVDTSSRSYIVSIASVSAGDLVPTLNFTNLTRVAIPNNASGGTGRSGQSAVTSLTGWNTFISSNKHYVIGVGREADSAVFDPSAITSYFDKFFLSYRRAQ